MKASKFTYALLTAVAILCGCSHTSQKKTSSAATTVLTPDREARMDAIVKRLTAQGYSESRARRIASKQVPLVQEQTQSSESLVDLVTGATAKREAEDAKFRKDLDQLAKPSK